MQQPRPSGVLLAPLFLLLVMVAAVLPHTVLPHSPSPDEASPTPRPPGLPSAATSHDQRPASTVGLTAEQAASGQQSASTQTDRPSSPVGPTTAQTAQAASTQTDWTTISADTHGSTTNEGKATEQTTKQASATDATIRSTASSALTSERQSEHTTTVPSGHPCETTDARQTAGKSSATTLEGTTETDTVSSNTDVPAATTTADKLKTAHPKTDEATAKTITDKLKTPGPTTDKPSPTRQTTPDALGTVSAKADVTSQKTAAEDPPTPEASSEPAPVSTSVASDTASTAASASTTGSLLEIEVEESTETGALNIDLRQPEDAAAWSATPVASTTAPPAPPAPPHHEDDETGGVLPDDDVQQNEVLDEDMYRAKQHNGPWLIGSRLAGQDDGEASLASSSTSSMSAPAAPSLGLYRNYDVDSQERERELEERAREQNHPADLEDTNVHEVNHYVPEDEQDDAEQQLQQQKSVARWYLLLLTGNATTVRLRQKDFAKYLKLNLAARLSVEYNDLRVNRVEFKPLLMVNVTIFSRPKDNEEAPLHMLADTNATLLELSGEEYHVLRFITIPSEHQEALAALASGGIQADSYTGANTLPPRHVDVGVAVYFAIAAGLVSILLAVFLVGLCRYLRNMAAEVAWPWRRYKPIVWSLPLQHRLCADHIAHCVPMRPMQSHAAVWTTADGAADVPVHKIPAPELPRRLVLEPRPHAALPPIVCADPAPSTADTLLQAQPAQTATVQPGLHACSAPRPNSKLSLFGEFGEQQVVVAPARSARQPGQPGRNRLQPQGRHPLDVRIGGRRGPTVLGLDNPNYMMQ
ncbi:agglutinin-like protein 1 [Thrips palmi]|uniref:Agglutinin-like protein 1 n=1 Tax=Thrips palmi TaxID=161013 RepID=A0A6P8Z0K8_THRPL|nr:agglutinin-like protein 1 [Thrips palmi]